MGVNQNLAMKILFGACLKQQKLYAHFSNSCCAVSHGCNRFVGGVINNNNVRNQNLQTAILPFHLLQYNNRNKKYSVFN